MTVLSVVTTKQQFGTDTLSITLRNVSGEPAAIQSMLVVKTVSLWLYLRKLIDAGERTSPLDKTPEMAVSAGNNITFEPWQETRCTVFDWSNHYGLTVHSDTMAQTALDTYWGLHDALTELAPQNAQQTALDAAKSRESAPMATTSHEAPKTPVEGVIMATRAPNPNETLYAEGQLVQFHINKIAAGSNKGSATFALWGDLGQKYPLITVYKCKPNSTDLKPDYIKAQPVLENIGLSFDNPEVAGSWTLICKAAHSKGKEYLNVLSLTEAS